MRQQGSVEDRIRHAFEGVDHPIPLEDVIASAEVQRRRRRGVVGLAAAGVLVTIFLVVVAFLPGSAPAYEWTREASSPDPEVVAGIPEWCTLPTDAGIGPLPPTVLVDQRGSAAAGLFTDEAQAWVCFVHFDGTNWTNDGNAGSGGPLDPFLPPVSIDSVTEWSGAVDITGVRGRVSEDVASVRVIRDDGQEIDASVRDGFYLAWWPTGDTVQFVVALDSRGNVLGQCAPNTCG